MIRPIALFFALSTAASPLGAQQLPLAGVWRISYAAGFRVENGTATPIMATGTLTIAQQGDSLIGDLVTDPSPSLPQRPPAHLAAPASAGAAVFISRTTATVNINGDKREATAVSTWTLRASADSLSGTVQRSIEGLEAGTQGPSPVTGTRRKP
jgi:hypothetical protein